MKGAALVSTGAAANLALPGASCAVAAELGAVEELPRCRADIPFNLSLAALVGSGAEVSRTVEWFGENDPQVEAELLNDQPEFAVDEFGMSLGVVAQHNGPSIRKRTSDTAESANSSLSLAAHDLGDPVWDATNFVVGGVSTTASGYRLSECSDGTSGGRHSLAQVLPNLSRNGRCTLSAVLRGAGARYVGLQLKTFANQFPIARFDLQDGRVASSYRVIDSGMSVMADDLFCIWATFDSQDGNVVPVMSLQLLAGNGKVANYKGSGRKLYISSLAMYDGEVVASQDGVTGGDAPVTVSQAPGEFGDAAWQRNNFEMLGYDADIAAHVISEGFGHGNHIIKQALPGLKQNSLYTVSAVLHSDQLQYVALQLRTCDDQYKIARFDMFNQKIFKGFAVHNWGAEPLGDGKVHFWAVFDSGAGETSPVVSLMLCDRNGMATSYSGSGRSVYLSAFYVSLGGVAAPPSGSNIIGDESSGDRFVQPLIRDAISSSGAVNIASNNCAGVFTFQYRPNGSGRSTMLRTGQDDASFLSLSISPDQLIFEKRSGGVSTVCAHDTSWVDGQIYRVGWRSSRATGMELYLDGSQVAEDSSSQARQDFTVGERLYFGSSGSAEFSASPVSNVLIFDEA